MKYETIKIIKKMIVARYNMLNDEAKKYTTILNLSLLNKHLLIQKYKKVYKLWYIQEYIKPDYPETSIGAILDDFNGYAEGFQEDLTDIEEG